MRPGSKLLALAAVALATNPQLLALASSPALSRVSPPIPPSPMDDDMSRIIAAEAKRARRSRKLAAERERIAYADIKRARRMWGAS